MTVTFLGAHSRRSWRTSPTSRTVGQKYRPPSRNLRSSRQSVEWEWPSIPRRLTARWLQSRSTSHRCPGNRRRVTLPRHDSIKEVGCEQHSAGKRGIAQQAHRTRDFETDACKCETRTVTCSRLKLRSRNPQRRTRPKHLNIELTLEVVKMSLVSAVPGNERLGKKCLAQFPVFRNWREGFRL